MNALDVLCAQLTRDLFAIAKFLSDVVDARSSLGLSCNHKYDTTIQYEDATRRLRFRCEFAATLYNTVRGIKGINICQFFVVASS